MKKKRVSYLYKKRAAWRRLRRLLFMSPAEAYYVRVMGGSIITADVIREPRNGFPLTIVLSLGPILKAERVRREVRVGAYFCDLGNDIGRGIEIDSHTYHQDIVHEQQRDEYFAKFGWRLLHIPVHDLYHTPNLVHDRTVKFLSE